MATFYSAGEGGFFDDAVHSSLPADAVKITKAAHRKLLDAQNAGAEIRPNVNGQPYARYPHADERRAMLIALTKVEARRRIEVFAPIWRQINAAREGTDPGWARIDALREASAFIEEQIARTRANRLADIDVANHPLWPEIDR